MPMLQVAAVQQYPFGAPAVQGEVLRFRVPRGGKASLTFENPEGENDGTVTVQVSEDGVTYANTTAAANLAAVVNEVVKRSCRKDFTILLRQAKDLFLKVLASGATHMSMQVRADQDLQIEKI